MVILEPKDVCREFRSPTMTALLLFLLTTKFLEEPIIYYFRRGLLCSILSSLRVPYIVSSIEEVFTDKASQIGELLNQLFMENYILLLMKKATLRFSVLYLSTRVPESRKIPSTIRFLCTHILRTGGIIYTTYATLRGC